jgi:ABC-type nitrate/sulfonate/bicarbonate transport system ATPase subunit
VDEAIILAGKVVVFGMNPGRVKKIRAVEILRPGSVRTFSETNVPGRSETILCGSCRKMR